MVKIEYNKLKEYCEYFLEDFKKDEKLKVEIRVDRPDAMTLIATVSSKVDKINGYSEFCIKFDNDTIHTFNCFYPDYYVDELDNTWEKYKEQEILKILDEQIALCKNAIKKGLIVFAYKNNERVMSSTFFNKNKEKFNFEKIYNTEKFKEHPNFEELTKIEVYDFHSNLLDTYTALR